MFLVLVERNAPNHGENICIHQKKIIEATLVMKFSPHTKDRKLIDEHAIEY
jgi:hypothetical protein